MQRYKGLGEMNPGALGNHHESRDRTLLKVTMEDAVGADEIFTILMGGRRRTAGEFIERNALDVVNLDSRSSNRFPCSPDAPDPVRSKRKCGSRIWTTPCPSSWGGAAGYPRRLKPCMPRALYHERDRGGLESTLQEIGAHRRRLHGQYHRTAMPLSTRRSCAWCRSFAPVSTRGRSGEFRFPSTAIRRRPCDSTRRAWPDRPRDAGGHRQGYRRLRPEL